MSDDTGNRGVQKSTAPPATKVGGTKLVSIMDDIVSMSARDVKSWLDATNAACGASCGTNIDILRSLAKSRGQNVAGDLELLAAIRSSFNQVETRRTALRAKVKSATAERNCASIFRFRRQTWNTDKVIVELLECESRRAELLGEAMRIGMRAQTGAKELYGQISALTGNGRVEKIVGLREVGTTTGGASNG